MCFGQLSDTNTAEIELTATQSTWLFDGFGVKYKDDVLSFLENNSCSNEAKQFTLDAINALMNGVVDSFEEYENLVLQSETAINSYTPTNYPGLIQGYPFQWWEDQNFIVNSGNFDMPSEILGAPAETPNPEELKWFVMFPAEAILHVKNADTAMNRSDDLSQNNAFNQTYQKARYNGKGDAFRHAFWNALDTAEIGAQITQIFTTAHEFGQSGIDVIMDLYNNTSGISIALSNNYTFTTGTITIEFDILIALDSGYLKYLKPTNTNGSIIIGVSQTYYTNQ